MSAAQAAEALQAAEFSGRFTWDESSEIVGEVVSQDPSFGEPDPEPRVVEVTVSRGEPFSKDEAIGIDWRENYPGRQSSPSGDDSTGADGRCSALGSRTMTREGLVVDPYVSKSGVGGGTLLVNVHLIQTPNANAAESLLAAERDAQGGCISARANSAYDTLPDGGATTNSTQYASATVAGYPALRTQIFTAAASPIIGGGVATASILKVAWRQGRYVVVVDRSEVFGQTLPPWDSGVPSDLEATVADLESSIAAEIARSEDVTREVREAKLALREAQRRGRSASTTTTVSAAPSGAGTSGSVSVAPKLIRGGNNSTVVIAGWDTQKPLGTARRVLGAPTTLAPNAKSFDCTAEWAGIGLTALLYNLGGSDPCSDAGGLLANAAMIGSQWRTAAGLRIGDPVGRLEALYPSARRGEYWDSNLDAIPRGTTRWLLFPYIDRLGGTGSWSSRLVAHVKEDKVVAFEADIGAGGE